MYFLAVNIMDKYLIACNHNGKVLENSDVHLIGIVSIYLASKMQDVYPIPSSIMSEKIAHGVISKEQILAKELEFLSLFNFEINFTTHHEF